MFRIVTPSRDEVERIQRQDGAFYWSGCVEGLLRKHGLIACSTTSVRAEAAPIDIVPRRLSLAMTSTACCIEGPCQVEGAKELGIRCTNLAATDLEFADADGRVLGHLAYPAVRTRHKPRTSSESRVIERYVAHDARWNNELIRFQRLEGGSAWKTIATALVGGAAERIPVAVSDGRRLVLGVPLFDLLATISACPPLSNAYHSHERFTRGFEIERWLIAHLVQHAIAGGREVLQASAWPQRCASAFTIRHDYDRPISDAVLASLLHQYAQRGLRSTWSFLAAQFNETHAKAIVRAGHEVNVHSTAATLTEFASEASHMQARIGTRPCGFTTHGGGGAVGFLGQHPLEWALAEGCVYGELLGPSDIVPQAANMVDADVPLVSSLVIPGAKYSLDVNTSPEGHNAEKLKRQLPRDLQAGAHTVIMNHPDIHIQHLFDVIDSLDLSRCWHATLAEVAEWFSVVHLRSQATRQDGGWHVRFAAPLPRAVELTMLRPHKPPSRLIVPAGILETTVSSEVRPV